jgi:hypothetical protein
MEDISGGDEPDAAAHVVRSSVGTGTAGGIRGARSPGRAALPLTASADAHASKQLRCQASGVDQPCPEVGVGLN